MHQWKKMLIREDKSILEALQVIDLIGQRAVIVVDKSGKLLGVVTDGDVRRAILRSFPLTSPVQKIMNTRPTTITSPYSKEEVLHMMKSTLLKQIPVVDENHKVIGVETLDHLIQEQSYSNPVVLMAGGQGKRLYPLTKDCPKPLLKLGNKPILQIIIENFISQGFRNFFLSVNYKAEMIENFFGDGHEFGCEIRYIRETEHMGTAGSLSLLDCRRDTPLIIMNGDLLTKANFTRILECHREQESMGTMCVREYDFQVPYGVAVIEDDRLVKIDEKPVHSFFVNGGIYILDPRALEHIPKNQYFDMPQLFQSLIDKNHKTTVFPLREYWLDIGRASDFERAIGDYQLFFE